MSYDDDPGSDDRRRSARVRVNEVVQFEVGGRRVIGLLTLINDSGFFVTTRHFLPPGTVACFEIDLPDAGRFLPVTGEVVLVNGPNRYDWRMSIGMAVRFESMDPVTRHIIDAYLERSRAMLGQRAS